MEEEKRLKKLLTEAYLKLFPPALGYIYNPKTGLAASVLAFTVYALKKFRPKGRDLREIIEEDTRRIIDLNEKIKELEQTIDYAKVSIEEVQDERKKQLMMLELKEKYRVI